MSTRELRRQLRRAMLHTQLWVLTLSVPVMSLWLWATRPLRRATEALNRYMMRFRLWRCAFVIAAFGITRLPAWMKRPWLVIPVVLVSQVVLLGPLDEAVGFALLALYVLVIVIVDLEGRALLGKRLAFAWSEGSSPHQIPAGVDATVGS